MTRTYVSKWLRMIVSWRWACHRKMNIIHSTCSKPPLYSLFERKAARIIHNLIYLTRTTVPVLCGTMCSVFFSVRQAVATNGWYFAIITPQCLSRTSLSNIPVVPPQFPQIDLPFYHNSLKVIVFSIIIFSRMDLTEDFEDFVNH